MNSLISCMGLECLCLRCKWRLLHWCDFYPTPSIHTHVHTHAHMPMHTCMHAHTHTHTHTHTHRGGGKDRKIAAFHKFLLNLSHVIMFRDKIDGSLRGIFMTSINHFEKYTTIRTYWAVIKNYYRGGPFLYLAIGYFILRGILMPLCITPSNWLTNYY